MHKRNFLCPMIMKIISKNGNGCMNPSGLNIYSFNKKHPQFCRPNFKAPPPPAQEAPQRLSMAGEIKDFQIKWKFFIVFFMQIFPRRAENIPPANSLISTNQTLRTKFPTWRARVLFGDVLLKDGRR